MQKGDLSRRDVVSGLAVAPALSVSTAVAGPNLVDVELVVLGRQLDSVPAALDGASDHDEAMVLLDRIETITAAMVSTPAKTLNGLYIKARATAWALQDDLDPTKELSINDRLAASIVRDLLELGRVMRERCHVAGEVSANRLSRPARSMTSAASVGAAVADKSVGAVVL
jgi:hypothetical protein